MLLKRGAVLKGKWRPRFFAIHHHDQLHYYVDEAQAKKRDKPRGIILLKGATLKRETTVKSPSLKHLLLLTTTTTSTTGSGSYPAADGKQEETDETFVFSIKPKAQKAPVMLSADTATSRDAWLAACRRAGAVDPLLDEEERHARMSVASRAATAKEAARGVRGTLGTNSLAPPGGRTTAISSAAAPGGADSGAPVEWWQQSLYCAEPIAESRLTAKLQRPLQAALLRVEMAMQEVRTLLLQGEEQGGRLSTLGEDDTPPAAPAPTPAKAGYVPLDTQRRVLAVVDRMAAQYVRLSPGSSRMAVPVEIHWWLLEGVPQEFWPALRLLLEPDFARVLHICSRVRSGENLDEVSSSLVEVGQLCGVTNALFTAILTKHVAQSSSQSTLFRVNSIASKMFAHVAKLDRLFLPRVLGRVARKIVQQTHKAHLSFEIDERKLKQKDPQQHKMNVAALEAFASVTFDKILSSIRHAPLRLRLICHSLLKSVERRYGVADAYKAVGAFIFLRLFCPAISKVGLPDAGSVDLLDCALERAGTPEEEAQLRATAAEPAARRNMLLIAKVLQSFANGVRFGTKEAYMTPLNKLLDTYQPRLRQFCVEFASPPEIERYEAFIPRTKNALSAKVAQIEDSLRILTTLATDLEADEAVGARERANQRKPMSELKKNWVSDVHVHACPLCDRSFQKGAKEGDMEDGGFQKHRCRSCGQVICGPCSRYRSPVPRYGFRATRVCDPCAEKIGLVDLTHPPPPPEADADEMRKIEMNLDLL